jgi:hypothetical protein
MLFPHGHQTRPTHPARPPSATRAFKVLGPTRPAPKPPAGGRVDWPRAAVGTVAMAPIRVAGGAAAARAARPAQPLLPARASPRRGPAPPGAALHRQAAGALLRPVKGAVALVRRIPRPQLPLYGPHEEAEGGGVAPVAPAGPAPAPPQPPAYLIQDDFALRPAAVPLAAAPPARLMPPPAPLPAAVSPAAAAPPRPAATTAAAPAASPHLAFARHFAAACNGAAPLPARMEALSLLIFHTGRAQAALLPGPAAEPASWLATPDTLALLEQVYEVGGALSDLGVGDTPHAAASAPGFSAFGGAAGFAAAAPASNGQRAVSALDAAGLLTRYLQQHGVALRDAFVAELPYDWLQVGGGERLGGWVDGRSFVLSGAVWLAQCSGGALPST